MDTSKIQEQSNELAKKLISADPTVIDAAVEQYFQPKAALSTDFAAVTGARRIKKILKVGSLIRDQSSEITDKPRYDSRSKTLKYGSVFRYVSPTLPSSIPFSAQLSGHTHSSQWEFVAHLAEDKDKLYVTKLEGKRKGSAASPIRPVLTFFALAAATIIAFFQAHRHDSPGNFVLSAFQETFNFVWSILLSEGGKRQAQADKWREEKVPQIKEYAQQAYSQAVDTATRVQSDLEARAKSAGIPVDDYKQRAAQAAADLSEHLEARAKAAGIPVEEYRKQADAAIEELKKRAAGVGEYLEGKAVEAKEQAEGAAKDVQKKADSVKKDKRVRENSNQLSQDQETVVTGKQAGHLDQNDQAAKEIRAEFAEVPHTPLGGHDPTAPNAPSFAQAAAI